MVQLNARLGAHSEKRTVDKELVTRELMGILHPTDGRVDCQLNSGAFMDGSVRCAGWNASQNVDIQASELATSVQDLTRSWNKCTQQWLERYVYTRFSKSLIITYAIAALWHGIAPGYYLFFLSMPLITVLERYIKNIISPWLVPLGYKHPRDAYTITHWLHTFSRYNIRQCMTLLSYYMICWFGTQYIMVYFGVVMFLQTWKDSIYLWGSLYYCGHILVGVLLIIFYIWNKVVN